MDNDFTIKDNKVFFKEKLLKSISPENFETLTFTNEHNQTCIKCLKDKKGVWFFNHIKCVVKFLTIDKDDFSIINEDYAKDSKNVFLIAKDGFIIPNSDAGTFEVLTKTPYFAKDKNQLYALDSSSGLSIYKYANSESIVSAGWNQFISDKHNLYHYSDDIKIANSQKFLNYLDLTFPYEKQKEKSAYQANKEFFQKLSPDIIGWWHKDYPYRINIENITQLGFYLTSNAVFYLENNNHLAHSVPTLVSKANFNFFQILNENYGMDNKNIFYKSLYIPEVDLKTFVVINNKLAKDKNNFYYNGKKIECDYDSFQAVDDYQMFYADKNTLFSDKQIREGKIGIRYEIINALMPLKNSSPETMKVFSSVWAKDNTQVYRYGEPYKKADPITFEYLNIKSRYDWAKDKNYLFNNSVKKIMKGIDGVSFTALNTFWGKDENSVFFFQTERILPSVDTKTFKIIDDNGGAIDKNYIYSVDENTELKKKKI